MDEIGQVFILDRDKDMINTAGFKVFRAEIEHVVAAHVAMVASAVSRASLRVRSPRTDPSETSGGEGQSRQGNGRQGLSRFATVKLNGRAVSRRAA
jgi:acyl-CoA synthetase (AMP-forming)/AMP-acid ligase II